MEKKEIQVLNNQSLADVAIQHLGSLEAVFDLARENDISITDLLTNNQKIFVPEPLVPEIVAFYRQNNISPSTAVTTIPIDTSSGINHWQLGIDFIVSGNDLENGVNNWQLGIDFIVQPDTGINHYQIGKDFIVSPE
ncbi:hypothetical protein HN014_08160 [Aquimarina sp. TRL1]|uniref:hypothetical protein n=1 Tax=Aquimarina sp. (strain TRL1) TaxID=2736252 RepID=UPI0015899A1E|nr:hypothetical protein [Aquimarina sp. TRL1]QKX04892.1 hypothetical protein HN014_08160 [Aquimarina sp. TRL1]